jgi:hypothetical protein
MTTRKPHAAFVLCAFQCDVADARRIIDTCQPDFCKLNTTCDQYGIMSPYLTNEQYKQYIGNGSLHLVLCNVGKLLNINFNPNVPLFIMPSHHSSWEKSFPINQFHLDCIISNPHVSDLLHKTYTESHIKGLEYWLWMSLLPSGIVEKVSSSGVKYTRNVHAHIDILGGKIDPEDYTNSSEHISSPAEVCAKREAMEESNGVVNIPTDAKLLHVTTVKSNTPHPSEIFYTLVQNDWLRTPPPQLPAPAPSTSKLPPLLPNPPYTLPIPPEPSYIPPHMRTNLKRKKRRVILPPAQIDEITNGIQACHISNEKKT